MNNPRPLALPLRLPGALSIRPVHGLLVSMAVIMLWGVWAVAFNVGQFGDNIEQFNWAQSLEWGYHKHPPLPTWILAAAIAVFGPSPHWTHLLATLCVLGTAVFTWLIGRRLLGERVASAAVVLWGLHLCFSQRVQLYNHNTLLVLCMAAAVWFALRSRDGGMRWWLATGVAAGAAVLSKYQAIVPLAGLLLALAWAGCLGTARQRLGLALAIGMLMLVVAPHAVWVVQHDFTTLRYASDAVESSSLWQRLGFLAYFFANQVRVVFPSLSAIGICWAIARRADLPPVARAPGAGLDEFGPWSVGLIWSSVCVLILLALLGGVGLRNHWGVQTFQFLCLWLAHRWDRRSPIDLPRLIKVALLVQGVSLALYATEHRDPKGLLSKRRIDTMYPAQRIADAALAHWHARTDCPLKFVSGDPFIAGMVSLHTDRHPKVYDTLAATPWIAPESLGRDGVLYVVDEDDVLPAGLEVPEVFALVLDERAKRLPKTIRIAMRPPAIPCP